MLRRGLGGLEVSAQGLGCAGMSDYYGTTDWDTSVAAVRRALDLGVTFFDTADVYGAGHNEVLLGRALAGHRDQAQIATKFGIDRSSGERVRRGAHGYVIRSCEASLLRLGTDVLDLYYAHRAPDDVPIEETVGAMSELVAQGKVRYLGLCEVDADVLRRAHAVHPIAALQSEYSVWTRGVEALAPVLAELGIGLVPYAPLGRGFLTGTVDVGALARDDLRRTNPRFTPAAFRRNQALADVIRSVAERLGWTPAQIALAWVHGRAERLRLPALVPIPGSKRPQWIEQNVLALEVELDREALAALEPLASVVTGDRY